MRAIRYSKGMKDILVRLLRSDPSPQVAVWLYDPYSGNRASSIEGLTFAERRAAQRNTKRAIRSLEARGDVEVWQDRHPKLESYATNTYPTVLMVRLTSQGRDKARHFVRERKVAEEMRLTATTQASALTEE